MNWISKIIHGKADEFVHAKLLKYGIGTHVGPRAFLKLSKNSITFKADIDCEKVFIRGYLHGVPSGKQKVKGDIVSYSDRITEFDGVRMPLSWKKSGGAGAKIFKTKLNEVAPLDDVRELLEKDGPTTFFLLSLNPSDGTKPWKITTKTSFPKTGQSDDGEEEKDPTFIKGALGNTPETLDYIIAELLPNFKDNVSDKAKKIEVRQDIIIEAIDIPENHSLSDRDRRKLAKKRGKLVRKITIDEKEYTSEHDFYV